MPEANLLIFAVWFDVAATVLASVVQFYSVLLLELLIIREDK